MHASLENAEKVVLVPGNKETDRVSRRRIVNVFCEPISARNGSVNERTNVKSAASIKEVNTGGRHKAEIAILRFDTVRSQETRESCRCITTRHNSKRHER